MRKLMSCLLIMIAIMGSMAAYAGPAFPAMLPQQESTASAVPDDDALIRAAVQTLRGAWQKEYAPANYYSAGIYTLDIRATQLIRIRSELAEREAKYFGDIDCIIEFLVYDDSLSMNGGGHGVGYHDVSRILYTVVVHRGGTLEAVKTSPIRLYASRTYEHDYSTFIEEVVDYGDQYNQVFDFVVW